MAKLTAEQAFEQGKRDMEMANEAVSWFNQRFGQMTGAQTLEIKALVLSLRYQAHIQRGELDPR